MKASPPHPCTTLGEQSAPTAAVVARVAAAVVAAESVVQHAPVAGVEANALHYISPLIGTVGVFPDFFAPLLLPVLLI